MTTSSAVPQSELPVPQSPQPISPAAAPQLPSEAAPGLPLVNLALLPPPASQIRASKPKSRNGKIARLPYLERDMVNRMLSNNIPQSKIVIALADHDCFVTERNISNWKTRGGYKEWCLAQEHAVQLRLDQDNLTDNLRQHDADQLPEVGLQIAATRLSQFLLRPEVQHQLTTDPDKYSRTLATLCRLAGQIHTQQKYRNDCAAEIGRQPARLKQEAEKEIEITRDMYSAPKLEAVPRDERIPHHNYLPRPASYPTADM